MKKHFKARKKKNKTFIIWFFIGLISLLVNNSLVNRVSKSYLINNDMKDFFNMRINSEKLLLSLGLNYKEAAKKTNSNDSQAVFKEITYAKPTIYVYNTHQTEEYTDGNVLQGAKYLKEKLEQSNISVIVEETDIAAVLKQKNYTYKDSYKITRELLKKKINDNTVLYIDLHRDSSSYNVSTVKIDNLNYARMMFVIGGKHESYTSNYLIADNLNKLLTNKNNKLTRGIYVRQSSSYNQDLNTNVILIELGGPHNNMEEVKRSIEVLADVILEYIAE